MANWSEIPSDVLEHLTSFLPIQDYHRFGAVCRNWGMVAKQKSYSPDKQIPWLALVEENDSENCTFYNLVEDKHYYLDVPHLHGKVICGSSYGWLFTLDRKLKFHLVNPFTSEYYHLPMPPRKRFVSTLAHKAILNYDPSKRSDFTAVILFDEDRTIAAWKTGNRTWTVVSGLPCNLNDVTFFKGKFYTVQNPVRPGSSILYSFEVGPVPKALKATQVEPRVPVHDPNNIRPDTIFCAATVNLVVSGGELLLQRFFERDERVHFVAVATEFVVRKLDLEKGDYSTCHHINGHAIFLSPNSSVVVSPRQFLKCRKDAIYFTNLGGNRLSCGAKDVQVYDLVTNNIVSYYVRAASCHKLATPVWFTPNPW